MDRIRSLLRALCIAGVLWSIPCLLAAAFLLSSVPLLHGQTIDIAGLSANAPAGYAVAGTAFLASSACGIASCLFGLRCARLVRHMPSLRALALACGALFVVTLVACLAIDRFDTVGWMSALAAVLLFAISACAGEVSRALLALRMQKEALDER